MPAKSNTPAEPEDASTVEKIAAEATTKTPTKPKGSPSFVPLTALRRRKRADFRRAMLKDIPPSLIAEADEGPDGAVALSSVDLSTPGLIDYAVTFLANIEDAYAIVAVDPEAYEDWVKDCSDDELSQLHEWYQAKYPMGEA